MNKKPTSSGEHVAAPDRSVETADRGRANSFRSADIALVEIAKLQSDGEHIKGAMAEVRKDAREVRDRLIALEVNVAHLPSKGFIVAVVIAALTIAGAMLALAPQLQRLAKMEAPASATQSGR